MLDKPVYVLLDKDEESYSFYAEFNTYLDAFLHIRLNGLRNYTIVGKPDVQSELQEGRIARLVVNTKEGVETNDFETLEGALLALESYNSNDGAQILALEQPIGSAPTYLMYDRPKLWKGNVI